MTIRCFTAAMAVAAVAGSASADIHELSIFRQLAARARNGSTASPTTDAHNSTNNGYGNFSDTQSASVAGIGAASANATQNTNVDVGIYSGMLHADAMSIGNGAGQSDASCSYGSPPNNFQTTFSVAFTVNVVTMAHFTGTASATRTGSGGSTICQVLLGDSLIGTPPQPPQPTIILAQPAANAPQVSWDVFVQLLPGHRYAFTANANASQNNIFNGNPGSCMSNISFTANVPAPGAAGILGLSGLCLLRRRR